MAGAGKTRPDMSRHEQEVSRSPGLQVTQPPLPLTHRSTGLGWQRHARSCISRTNPPPTCEKPVRPSVRASWEKRDPALGSSEGSSSAGTNPPGKFQP